MNFLLTWKHRLDDRLEQLTAPLGLLVLRLWLAQEFIQAGWIKLSGGLSAPDWFRELSFPIPVRWLSADMNWVTAGLLETGLGFLLVVGLCGRLASVGLMFVTWVAVYSVHFDLGWAGWNQIETDAGQGYKVPLMIGLMLFALMAKGMGAWSVDGWLAKRVRTAG